MFRPSGCRVRYCIWEDDGEVGGGRVEGTEEEEMRREGEREGEGGRREREGERKRDGRKREGEGRREEKGWRGRREGEEK